MDGVGGQAPSDERLAWRWTPRTRGALSGPGRVVSTRKARLLTGPASPPRRDAVACEPLVSSARCPTILHGVGARPRSDRRAPPPPIDDAPGSEVSPPTLCALPHPVRPPACSRSSRPRGFIAESLHRRGCATRGRRLVEQAPRTGAASFSSAPRAVQLFVPLSGRKRGPWSRNPAVPPRHRPSHRCWPELRRAGELVVMPREKVFTGSEHSRGGVEFPFFRWTIGHQQQVLVDDPPRQPRARHIGRARSANSVWWLAGISRTLPPPDRCPGST